MHSPRNWTTKDAEAISSKPVNPAHAAHEGPMQLRQGLIPPAAPKRPKPT